MAITNQERFGKAEEAHRSYGHDLVAHTWELTLTSSVAPGPMCTLFSSTGEPMRPVPGARVTGEVF